MALQGDLQSFALPDVLRLLAGTSKTGRLGVTGVERTGDVWLRDGQIVGGAVSSAPHAYEPADVVFELLRFENGSFAFEDDEAPSEANEPTSVDDAIGRAEELVREWDEVESVVPSVESWVTFAPEIEGDATTVSADHWRTLAIVGSGLTVREVGDHFEVTDLAASRRVKELVEAGLVDLGDVPADRPAPAPSYDQVADTEVDDLSVLRADDGPVVLETSEDALLPEPLPSEGTSFEGDLNDMTSVDGRSFGAADEEPPAEEPAFGAYEPYEAPAEPEPFTPYGVADPVEDPVDDVSTDPFASFGPDPAAHLMEEAPAPEPFAAAPAPERHDPFGDDGSQPFGGNDDFFGAPSGSNATEEVSDDPLDSTPSTDAASDAAAEGGDSDRGALLNFLSTVKH